MSDNQPYLFPMPQFSRSPIDIHSHFNHGSPYDCPENNIHLRSLSFIQSEYERVGISQVGMSTYASVLRQPECVPEENRYMHKMAQETPWMYQWVVIDPRQEETYRQAEEMLPHPKVLGIKIHPSYHGYDVLDYGDALFSFADRHKAVILMHPQSILQMPELADKYPNMKLIIAHLHSEEYAEAILNARHGNIYADTSASRVGVNHILEYTVSQVGSQKLLFGTDTYSYGFQFGRIALSDIPHEDKENILWKNAVEMFPRAFG